MQPVIVKTSDIFDYLDEYKYQNKKSVEDFLLDLTIQRPFGDQKFYIFSFLKHNMKGMGEKTLFHQPRLTKPEPTDSSMLFRVDPGKVGDVEVLWILPDIESIHLFQKGKLFENEIVNDSIRKYVSDKNSLRQPEVDDIPEHHVKEIYKARFRQKGIF